MNEKLDEKNDPLYKLIQEAGPEEVGSDFLSSILVQLDQKTTITSYKPIISKKSWLIFGLIFIIITVFSITQVPAESNWSDFLYIPIDLKVPTINIDFRLPALPTIFKTNIMAQSIISFIILSFAFIIIRNKLIELK